MTTRTESLSSSAGSAPDLAAGSEASLRRAGRWLLPLALVALAWWALLRHADFPQVRAQARHLSGGLWLGAGLALLGGHGLRAWRLREEWRHLGLLAWPAVLRLVLTHNAAVLLMPMRTGEAGYLWLVHRAWGVGWREAARSLLWWRVQDAAVLLLLGLLLLPPMGLPARIVLALSWLVAAATLAPRALAGVDGLWTRRHAGPANDASPGHRRDPRAGAGIAAAIWTTKVLVLGGLVGALTGLAPEAAWRAALGGELGGVMPLQGPAGLGNYEAGAWLAASGPRLALAPAHALIAAVLAVHVFCVAVALGAAALLHLWPTRSPA